MQKLRKVLGQILSINFKEKNEKEKINLWAGNILTNFIYSILKKIDLFSIRI